MLTICTDTKSQKHWTPPQPGDFKGMFVVPVMGMAFRFWLGRVLPPTVDQLLLFPADGKIFSRDCWDVFGPMLEPLFKDPLPD